MANFKPQVSYISDESLRKWQNAGYWVKPAPSKSETHRYDTYRELKKDIKKHCERCIEVEGVYVVRSRRGSWGEYFEYWKLDNNGKPYIDREGWM